ncbi:MAG: hypothetical protein LAP13_14540 [Acidobacteriia bacterium]|nr:hypothetical protein [Terriglobia bacterium]
MTRRDLLSAAALAPLALSAKPSVALGVSSARSPRPSQGTYAATAPETLDLSDRAAIALNALSGTLDPENKYEMYFGATFVANPPYMFHETTGLPTNNPKYAESFPMMRVMSGSDRFLDIEKGMMDAMLSLIAKDGLYYSPALSSRPWNKDLYPGPESNEDFANVYGNSRLLLAFMAWMQYDPAGPWEEKAAGIARALSRIAVRKDDYAYYPDSRIGEAFSYPKSGWRNTDEPEVEAMGAEGSMFVYHSGPIRALTRWYLVSGDKQALETATRVVRFVTKKRFWGARGVPDDITSADRAYFTGHMHGHTAMLWALLEYAVATSDSELINFVRDGYEFARHHGIPRLGAWLNDSPDVEVCTISDMIAMAIKLTEAGIGDYYEDVDQAVRNQLVESQFLRADFLQQIVDAAPKHIAKPPRETSERVIERCIGSMAPMLVIGYDKPFCLHCCTGNGTQAFYYAWSKIVEPRGDAVRVNLLLNRVSPWMDIDSYLPYEGKVILHNKTAKAAFVRLPYFVDPKNVQVSVPSRSLTPHWMNKHVLLSEIRPGEEIQITFPIKEDVATYTLYNVLERPYYSERGHSLRTERQYACRFRGNTLVEISPRVSMPSYPLYLRDHFRQARAPLTTKPRYVASRKISW